MTQLEDTFESIPTTSLDEIVHQRVRLGILTIVHEARRVEFSFFAEALSLTGGNLSQHLRVLQEAGHIKIDKGAEGRRPRTWVSITASGRRAFLNEIDALKAIVSRVESASGVGD